MYEKLIKRIIWVAECQCGERVEKDQNPPRERYCGCGRWVPFKEVSFTGPDTAQPATNRRTR